MITGNKLCFGYGDIAVEFDSLFRQISFQQFKPPAEPGDYVKEGVEFLGDRIKINMLPKEYEELYKYLKAVKQKEITSFEFKGYIFDFSNYNEKSISVVCDNAERAMKWYYMSLAA